MVDDYRRYKGPTSFPRLFVELGYQGFIFEADICVTDRETEGLSDDIGRKGENLIPLRGNESALMYIEGISEPGDEINARMDLGGDLVVESRHNNSETVCILAMEAEKQRFDTAYVKRVFRVADTRLQVIDGFKTRGVPRLTDLGSFWLVLLGRSPPHG